MPTVTIARMWSKPVIGCRKPWMKSLCSPPWPAWARAAAGASATAPKVNPDRSLRIVVPYRSLSRTSSITTARLFRRPHAGRRCNLDIVVALQAVDQHRHEPGRDKEANDEKAEDADFVELANGVPQVAMEAEFLGDQSKCECAADDDGDNHRNEGD